MFLSSSPALEARITIGDYAAKDPPATNQEAHTQAYTPGDWRIKDKIVKLSTGIVLVEIGLSEVAQLLDKGDYEQAETTAQDLGNLIGILEMTDLCFKRSSEHCHILSEASELNSFFFAIIYDALGESDRSRTFLEMILSNSDTPKEVDTYLRFMVSRSITRQDYESALAHIFTAVDIGRSSNNEMLTQAAARLGDRLISTLFDSISWDPTTGGRRSDDPRDFADDNNIGIGRSSKYGMTNPDEDHATFATLVFMSETLKNNPEFVESEEVNPEEYALDSYIRTQIAEQNFEPAAKYLLTIYLDGGFSSALNLADPTCPSSKRNLVSFEEILTPLDKSQSTDPHTILIIRLASAIKEFLEERCTRSDNQVN